MRPSSWVSTFVVAFTLSRVCAGEAWSAEGPAKARIWFEHALDLDVGTGGAPDSVQAFAAMRQAADAGDPLAAFNVAVMLDSGRGAARNVMEAAIWYARSAAQGVQRGAFNLGLLYETGDGVPVNVDLSRAWYASSNLPAARDRLAGLRAASGRPAQVQAPKALYPIGDRPIEADDQQVDLVWTSFLEPEPVRFFVELRGVDVHGSSEAWSGFVDVSSVRLPLPSGVRTLAWRVSAVGRDSADYAVSAWSIFTLTQGGVSSDTPDLPTSDGAVGPPETGSRKQVVSGAPRIPSERQAQMLRRPLSATSDDAATVHATAPAATAHATLSRSDAPERGAQRSSQEDKVTTIAPPSGKTVQKSELNREAGPDHASGTPPVARAVLIILAQPSVTTLSDLNNKAVVIAGLKSISRADVETALNAAGATAADLTEGTKNDIDKLLDGEVSAAIVACVTPAKAQSFPEIAGLRLLRVPVTDLRAKT